VPKKVQLQRVKEIYHCAADGWTFPMKESYKHKRRTVTDTAELWPMEAEVPEETPAPPVADAEQGGLHWIPSLPHQW